MRHVAAGTVPSRIFTCTGRNIARLLEAKKITEDELLRELGGQPGEECHCEKLAVTTMQKTISKYKEDKKRVYH
jgi:hypothetical protein